jgi:hypothetical protein
MVVVHEPPESILNIGKDLHHACLYNLVPIRDRCWFMCAGSWYGGGIICQGLRVIKAGWSAPPPPWAGCHAVEIKNDIHHSHSDTSINEANGTESQCIWVVCSTAGISLTIRDD